MIGKLPRPDRVGSSARDPGGVQLAALVGDQVRITYVGHSTFLIESPQLVRIATDYNDYVKPPVLPDIVTMNHAHSTHYTDRPDPDDQACAARLGGGIRQAGAPRHAASRMCACATCRPISATIGGGTERHGNSIFIFEIANLCIAHLGHLHHTLIAAAAQRDRPGRCGDGAGRRHLHARHRGHDRGAAGAESAADDPDAFFQRVHARPISSAARGKNSMSNSARRRRWSCRRQRCRQNRNSWCCQGVNALAFDAVSLYRCVGGTPLMHRNQGACVAFATQRT